MLCRAIALNAEFVMPVHGMIVKRLDSVSIVANGRESTVKLRQFFILTLIALFSLVAHTGAAAQESEFRIVGYYTFYSIYDAQYFITDVPADRLTHLIYASVNTSTNGQCVSTDAWADTQFSYPGDKQSERLRGNFKQLQLLRRDSPNLKILMSIGGWEQSRYFSDVASNRQARIRFARSCIAFMREYGFDGIDLDWRYPVSGGLETNAYRPEDKDNFVYLLAEFRGQLEYWNERDNKRYTLTMTAPAVGELHQNYHLDQVHTYVDWINLQSYGYQGSWSELASPISPLYGSARDPRGDIVRNLFNVAGSVKTYLDMGIPAEKIVVGVGFFGQAWRITQPNDFFGLYQPAQGIPTGTRPGGILQYRDLVPLLGTNTYTRFFDEDTRTPWLYNEDRRIVISYEDPASVAEKAAFVRSNHLGGIMIWELSFDDEQSALLEAVFTTLNPGTQIGR